MSMDCLIISNIGVLNRRTNTDTRTNYSTDPGDKRTIKEDLHRRFDHVEDLLDDGSVCGTKLERDQAAILANLRRVHGEHRFPDREDEE